nr:response regulator [Magnetospirillum sp. ME-1]
MDGSPIWEMSVHMTLHSLGAKEIVEVANGAEALAALQAGGFDIVIMDWKMEVMDGMECTRRIRAGIEGIDAKIPIILLTSMAGKDAEEAAYAVGANLYMEKPFSLKQIHTGVRKVLGHL